MKRDSIGELEELVLLTVGALADEAYGVAVMEEIERQTGRKINISAIHTVLKRLEAKGFLKSSMGGATEERGGRRKRIFQLTIPGKRVLDEVYELRTQLYGKLQLNFE